MVMAFSARLVSLLLTTGAGSLPLKNIQPKPLTCLSDHVYQICGDDVGFTLDGELFVTCNECAFPVCRSCYEYERKEGAQSCSQCRTRYKRLKGSARVEGDEEEDGGDDIENEFDYVPNDRLHIAEAMLQGNMSYGHASDHDMPHRMQTMPPSILLLTNGSENTADPRGIPLEHHALVVPPTMGGGKRIHPLPYLESNLPVNPRPLDPSKDIAAYGFGSVTWKERMESWKSRQEKLQVVRTDGRELAGGKGGDNGYDYGDPDLPMILSSIAP